MWGISRTLIASSGGAAGSPGSDASADASPGTQFRSRSKLSASARRAVRRSPSRGLPHASVGSPPPGIHSTRRKARSLSSTAGERPRRGGTGRNEGISSSFSRTGRSSADSPSVSRRHLPAGHCHSRIVGGLTGERRHFPSRPLPPSSTPPFMLSPAESPPLRGAGDSGDN
jgi:hypothetical protein